MTQLAAPIAQRSESPPPEHNLTGVNFRAPMPWPKVRGRVIDFHCHLLAARHARVWFEAAAHYGIDQFVTMCQLEEAMVLQREWGDRLQFIAVPAYGALTDRIGRRPVFMFGAIMTALLAFPLFWMFDRRDWF